MPELAEKQEERQQEHTFEEFNLAYKAIFLADGVGFLFEEIAPFSANDVKAGVDPERGTFIAMGKNLIPITVRIMRALEKHRTFFLYKSPLGNYDEDSTPIAFELEEDVIDKLRKLLEVT